MGSQGPLQRLIDGRAPGGRRAGSRCPAPEDARARVRARPADGVDGGSAAARGKERQGAPTRSRCPSKGPAVRSSAPGALSHTPATMDISVVGAGRVGTALAVLLARAGHRVVGVSGGSRTADRASKHLPGVPVGAPAWVAADADIVIIATPDDRIALICSDLASQEAFRPDQTVVHLSGATGLGALAPARDAGAA